MRRHAQAVRGDEPVIVRLIGGLGNQMFQYAAGRAVALRCGAELKLDLSSFETYRRRRYELDTFAIEAVPATSGELASFGINPQPRWPLIARIRRKLGMPAGSRARPVHREPHFHFDPAMLALRAPVYLDGYWQSEKYFADCAETIRRELMPRAALEGKNAAVADEIDASDAVSVHVRRGDYVNDPTTNRYHGTCSPDYYRRAARHVAARLDNPHVFVFSDDPEWTRGNLDLGLPTTYVDANASDRGYLDMQLMARCRHHVLANSSFSWWGAWLNPSPDKTVVAPVRWFNAGADTRDLIPSSWVRL